MHNRKVFIAKDVNYGSSKTSTTVNTAVTPDLLAEGAIGVYGIDPTSANNAGKIALLTDGGSDAAGLIPAADFAGSEVFVCVGTANGVQMSNRIDGNGIKRLETTAYSAFVLGLQTITLDWPTEVNKGDLVSLSVVDKAGPIFANRQPFSKERYSDEMKAGAVAYDGAAAIAARVAQYDANERSIQVPVITTTASGSPFANTATADVVEGATGVTTSAAHGVDAGDYITFTAVDDVYKAVAVTSTTITLDRPYGGVTETVGNGDTADLGATAPTGVALLVSDIKQGQNLEFSLQGIIEDSVVTVTTPADPGKGTLAQVTALEQEALPKKGSHDQITSYMRLDTLKVDTSLNGYDLYDHTIKNEQHPNGDPGSVFKVLNYVTCAFPEGVADTAGKNQSDFEDIMVNFFPGLVTLF